LYTSIHNIFSRGSLQNFDQNFHRSIPPCFVFFLLCFAPVRVEVKNSYGPKGTRGEKAHMAFQFDLFVKDIQHVYVPLRRGFHPISMLVVQV